MAGRLQRLQILQEALQWRAHNADAGVIWQRM
jgi:hypothetical protein